MRIGSMARKNNIRETLTRTRIAPDLLATLTNSGKGKGRRRTATAIDRLDVIVEFNVSWPSGAAAARDAFFAAYERHVGTPGAQGGSTVDADVFSPDDKVDVAKSRFTENYAFCKLKPATIDAIASIGTTIQGALVYKIWLDHRLAGCVYTSARTVKCDAARSAFAASGEGIVWAVADTGIASGHPHFRTHGTTNLPDGLAHRDFTESYADEAAAASAALRDADGHGTHVAGIIAGETGRTRADGSAWEIVVHREERVNANSVREDEDTPEHGISGLAPRCKILSLKVLRTKDDGALSNLLAALGYVQVLNGYGRNLRIHGVNLSLGYPFDPEWFGAGQSPLCVEVDRLVRSGVCVVAAAGNGGYGTVTTYLGSQERASHGGTINDPGNAELAITVGATHRDAPHAYGVSYFSAKGPTADGRMKPDLVAPGERIVSCALPGADADARPPFREESGTSMAAPHVSGAIAAFLSVRGEFRGRPERVKEIFLASAMDLRRRPEFQGAGLMDLMKALQSI